MTSSLHPEFQISVRGHAPKQTHCRFHGLTHLPQLDEAFDELNKAVETAEVRTYAYKKAVRTRSRLVNVERIALNLLNGRLA